MLVNSYPREGVKELAYQFFKNLWIFESVGLPLCVS